jgi:Flp pilus assembly protein TadD
VLVSMIAGCAAPQQKTSFGGKADVNVGLATRALAALNAHDTTDAVNFAERAVEQSPNDAGFRALLGNAYFSAGRFWSAEAAYKDSLSLYSNQPQVILKLALVETALGKKDQAVAFLHAGQSVLDPSNYGLALALAGNTDEAIPVLQEAARASGADATVRQNLALAYALAGNWTEAKTIAAQDVPAAQLDTRIHQWMQLATPARPADQVAALVGVTPAAVDHGQPIRLALNKSDTLLAAAAPAPAPVPQPAPAPVPQPAPQPKVAQAAPPPQFVQAVAAPAPAPKPAPMPAIAAAPPAPRPQPKPVIAEAPSPAPVTLAMMAAAAPEAPAAFIAFQPKKTPAPAPKAKPHHAPARQAPRPGEAVVQLGSYSSPQQVTAGWNRLTQRYPALRAYFPLRARFNSPKGTFWRLSIQGFSNQREAIARCALLKSHGGRCFVRGVAGDAPVQIASN